MQCFVKLSDSLALSGKSVILASGSKLLKSNRLFPRHDNLNCGRSAFFSAAFNCIHPPPSLSQCNHNTVKSEGFKF